jgi:hypothetical protein
MARFIPKRGRDGAVESVAKDETNQQTRQTATRYKAVSLYPYQLPPQKNWAVINKMTRLVLLLLAGARYYHPHYNITAHAATIVSSTEEWCLKRGFDPTNLSCDTCALIDDSITLQRLQKETNDAIIQRRQKEGGETTSSSRGSIEEEIIDISSECRTCCKSYKVNPILRPGESLRGKYRYALLTYNENSIGQYSEIQDFIQRDVNDIVSFKGESRFKAIPTSSSDGHHRGELDNMMMMYGGLFGGGGGPPKLLLFEKQKKGGWSSEDEDEAEEVINLRGWKREDVKDMLMTLLPNA